VVSNCKNGDMNIIKTSQPMKLAFGSKRIMGMPKFRKSDEGSKSMIIIRPQIAHITRKVKSEVMTVYLMILLRTSSGLRSRLVILLARYQPTTNPNNIQKIGTPIPIPTHKRSRIMKSRKAVLGFKDNILCIS
jgi:hypothetical protein